MALKVKKEALAPPKANAKGKALKAKKVIQFAVHNHRKKIHMSPNSWWPKTQDLWQ